MLGGFIFGFIVAWLLSCFGVDQMVLEVVQPMVSMQLTASHFYVALGLIGLVGGAFRLSVGKVRENYERD